MKKKNGKSIDTTIKTMAVIFLVYIFITLLAVVSEIMNNDSNLFKMFWPQLIFSGIMIYILYISNKNLRRAIQFEVMLGIIMLVYVICHKIYYATTVSTSILNFIFPITYIVHPVLVLNSKRNDKRQEELKEKFIKKDK